MNDAPARSPPTANHTTARVDVDATSSARREPNTVTMNSGSEKAVAEMLRSADESATAAVAPTTTIGDATCRRISAHASTTIAANASALTNRAALVNVRPNAWTAVTAIGKPGGNVVSG